MHTTTTVLRWLCLCLVVAGFTGTAYAQRTVTLRLNTATLPDTLDASDVIQVRGAVDGQAPFTLPDSKVISWGDDTTVRPENAGGDYWNLAFQIPENQEVQFKFYSQLAEDHGIGGWEDDAAGGGNFKIEAGTGDLTLPLHYFNKTGAQQSYDWRPFASKQDSVGVWFRVYMNTDRGATAGYDAADPNEVVGLRGDDFSGQGPIDWGTSKVTLQRESSDKNQPGYHLFSGVAYYPQSLAGQTQAFKFLVEPGGWEGNIDNRTFTIPSQDTTLHWVYFDNGKPVSADAERVTANVIFNVDVAPLELAGVFSRARGDTMIVRGDFNQWSNCLDAGNPDACSLFEQLDGSFGNSIPVSAFVGDEARFKFFADFNFDGAPDGWEEPLDYGGGNRVFVFQGEDNQELGLQYYNNIRPGNVIPAGTSVDVTFQVDMRDALRFGTKETFNPQTDQVWVNFEDGIWIYTQRTNKGVEELDRVVLSDPDGDMVYTGTYTVVGPTYNGIGYRYNFGTADETKRVEEGSGGFDPGRRRYQYVLPNQDGSWPAAYTMPVVVIKETGSMPFECNPTGDPSSLPESVQALCYPAGTQPAYTGIEVVNGEIPSQVSLGSNYPNPFNPTTSFEYTVTQSQHVRVRVYDLMGRVVATLVDGVQPAATYRITFDASHLASGVYLYQLETPARTVTKKMTLVK